LITKKDLLKWLREIDLKLNTDITLIAVGGTAMTLLGLKSSTIDVDFCMDSSHAKLFTSLIKGTDWKVDIFIDGYIFSEQLPKDYADLSQTIPHQYVHLTLKILSPEDIIITKAARYNERDEEDIETLAKTGKVDKLLLVQRFRKVKETYAGKKEDYEYHFDLILKRHFNHIGKHA